MRCSFQGIRVTWLHMLCLLGWASLAGLSASLLLALEGDALQRRPQLIVRPDRVDLGVVTHGAVVPFSLELTHNESSPIQVSSVTTSCGCLSAGFKPTVLQSGESLKLPFSFATEGSTSGRVFRSIRVIAKNIDQEFSDTQVVVSVEAEVVMGKGIASVEGAKVAAVPLGRSLEGVSH